MASPGKLPVKRQCNPAACASTSAKRFAVALCEPDPLAKGFRDVRDSVDQRARREQADDHGERQSRNQGNRNPDSLGVVPHGASCVRWVESRRRRSRTSGKNRIWVQSPTRFRPGPYPLIRECVRNLANADNRPAPFARRMRTIQRSPAG